MTITYKGCSEDYGYRVAEIFFSEEEHDLVDKAMDAMCHMGYKGYTVSDEYALIEVDDKLSFKTRAEDMRRCYKRVKAVQAGKPIKVTYKISTGSGNLVRKEYTTLDKADGERVLNLFCTSRDYILDRVERM